MMENKAKYQTMNDSAVEVIDLSYYWQVVRRQLKMIIALSIIATLISVLVVLSMTPKYKATTTILIEAEEAKVLSIEEVYGLSGKSSEYFLTQFEILKSREMAKRVVEKLNLVNDPEFNPFHPSVKKGFSLKAFILGEGEPPTEKKILDATIDNFWDVISVSPVRKTQLVKVSVETEDKDLAPIAANAVAQAYIESQLEAKVGVTQQAADWLGDRLGGLKTKLENSERELQDFREKNNLIDVKGVNTLYAKELDQITEKLVDSRNNRLNIEGTYTQLQKIKQLSYENLSSLPVILKNPLIVKLRENETTAELKVSELSKRYGPKHPRMIAAQSDLDAVRESVLTQMKRLASGIKQDYQVAKTQERSLEKALNEVKKKIQSLNRTEFELSEYTREVQANRSLYNAFFKRIRETSETGDLQTANARIVDPAVLPEAPFKPKKKLIVSLVMVVSVMFGIALAFLRDALDATVKNAEDVDRKLGFAMLGLVPMMKREKALPDTPENAMARAFAHNGTHGFKESVRTLRTSLTLASLESPAQVLLFTSSVPAEGKTTTSLNLATAYGQMEKVLLIDADMRRPTVAKQLRLPSGSKGLSNAVANPETLDECIYSLEDMNIDVIPAGFIPPNPLELLSSKNFTNLLETLKGRYQRIIIDSAPMQAVSDALYLSTLADGVVYVIKSDATKDKLIKGGLGRLDDSNARILGVVLNQVDVDKEAKYGGHYGGYYDTYEYKASS
ncbi:GumC family protein [Bacterioplanoides sp.]|uniref:GumC family protein n=1 Tax=Bacterioplanoides sp. TaxID=2066072 RepID=UPI003B5C2F09